MSFSSSCRFHRRVLSYYWPHWPLLAVWLLLIGVSTGVGLLTAWPMAILVDGVLSPLASGDRIHQLVLAILPASKAGKIIGLGGITLALKLLADLIGTAQSIVSNQISYSGLISVRCDVYRKLQSLCLAYHHSRPQGDAIYRLSNDTQGCQTILSLLVSALTAAVTLLAMLFVLGTRSWRLTAVAFSIAPFLAGANFIFARRFNQRTVACREVDSRFMTAVQRSIGSIRLVQAFAREDEEFQQFRGTINDTIAAWWSLNREQFLYNLIVGALFGIGGAMIFGYGGFLVVRGSLSLGDLLVFTSYLGMLWGPLCQLTGFSASVQSGAACATRVFEILDSDPVIADLPNAIPLPPKLRRLELDGVTFGYDPQRPVLREVSLAIEPGQLVAFVGASGVGKSTLLNLLPRFYDPTQGSIRLDGTDLRNLRIKDLRKNVALVLQDSVILPTSIAENISYGRANATRDQINAAADMAGATEFIEQMENGFDTTIAEGGVNLSGGQRQRLAIARALVTEAPFILLDEPTSALDPHHERLITKLLSSLKRCRTVIVVTHRLSTTIACDQIFAMQSGRIIQRGNYWSLIQQPGLFCDMAADQLSGDILSKAG